MWFAIAGLLVSGTDLGLHYFVFSYVLLILFTVVGCLVWCVVCCGLGVMRWLVHIVVWLGLCYCLDFAWFVGWLIVLVFYFKVVCVYVLWWYRYLS